MEVEVLKRDGGIMLSSHQMQREYSRLIAGSFCLMHFPHELNFFNCTEDKIEVNSNAFKANA